MKQALILLLLLVALQPGNAQQVLFKEDFTYMQGLQLSQGWTTYSAKSVGWRTSNMYNLYCYYSAVPQYTYHEKVAAVSGCYGDKHPPQQNINVLAYTQSINLKNLHDGAVLKYDSYFNQLNAYYKYERATVEVSINDGKSWTTVQQVPGGKPDSFSTWYVDLSQYQGYGNVRVGFRYSDQGVDHKYGGWAIDNIELYIPAKFDLALEQFSPTDSLMAFVVQHTAIKHYGTVINKGLDTIHSFVINYRRDGSYILADTINATIPPLTKYNFAHAIPDTISNTGRTNITAWVSALGDTNPANDTIYTHVQGAYFNPKKLVLVEEGTSTKNIYGPRGHVYMNTLDGDGDACKVSIHSQDPMGMEAYSSYMYALKYYSGQYFLLDRQYVDPEELFKQFPIYNQHFGFADLEVTGSANEYKAEIEVNVQPAVDITGDFRLILILTEDHVTGTTSSYNQANGYINGVWGPMGGYEHKTDPVLANDMEYRNVARYIDPSADGGQTFATELKYNGNYNKKFSIRLDPKWDRNKLRAIAVLYKADDTLILNSSKLPFFLSVAGTERDDIQAGIYPNPAHTFTTLYYTAKEPGQARIIVTDISGRQVQLLNQDFTTGKNEWRLDTGNLSAGLYIINIIAGDARQALKLQVMH